jgi:hypothetical protein
LNKAMTDEQIMERDIITLDLRMDGRMIVETPDAIEKPKPIKTNSKI